MRLAWKKGRQTVFEMGVEVLGGKRGALEGTVLLHGGGEGVVRRDASRISRPGRVGGSCEHPQPRPPAAPNITFPRLAGSHCPRPAVRHHNRNLKDIEDPPTNPRYLSEFFGDWLDARELPLFAEPAETRTSG